ncbi:hypothetical protein [Streptomyces halstedii]|uniref:hypothetical protein n=1 Tax=Streptomyces halstedii TaxID=1944 RepID=UPI00368DBCF4
MSILVAVTRPIIAGIYHSIGQDTLRAIGKREDIKLQLLGKISHQGDGDTGIAFDYAVHDAVVNGGVKAPLLDAVAVAAGITDASVFTHAPTEY